MPFAAYNSNGVRLLCGALADSLEYVRKATGPELSEAEVSDIRKTLVHRLTLDHDSGECSDVEAPLPERSGLKRPLPLILQSEAGVRSIICSGTGAPRLFLQVVNLEPALCGRTREPARNPFLHLG